MAMVLASPPSTEQPQRAPAQRPQQQHQGRARQPGGGPSGRAPLVRALRAKQGDARRVASAWHDRFERDGHSAIAELVSLVLVVADAPAHAEVARDDVQDREPSDVVQQLVAALALEASEKGADFTQHWLVSRERGAQRVRENYPAIWREIVASASSEALLEGGLLQLLRDWTAALSECQFRSVRHASTAAALSVVEGLGAAARALEELCGTASVQIRDAEAQQAADRLATLSAEHAEAQRAARGLATARDSLGVALLSRRAKDVDPEVRRGCFDALRRWVAGEPASFLDPQWTRYLHFGIGDRDPKVRSAVFSVLEILLQKDPAVPAPAAAALIEHAKPKILARCHDIDAAVGAAAIRCASAIAASELLGEAEYDPVIDLVWDADARRRAEAAAFISRFVLTEDVLDYPAPGASGGGSALLPTGACGGAVSRRRVLMLLQFIGEYTEGHYRLVDRLAAALWRRASCLEDWETIASLALPGGEHALTGPLHVALVHLAEAVARLASEDIATAAAAGGAGRAADGLAHAEAVLDRAARALAPRVPALLGACQAEPAAMRRAASLCKHVLAHAAARQGSGAGGCEGLLAGLQGEATAEALKAAFLRQPDPDTLEHCADALAHLLDLSAAARPAVLDLATALHGQLLKFAPLLSSAEGGEGGAAAAAATAAAGDEEAVPPADATLAVAARLRILAKAFDVSLCRVREFSGAVLGLLDDRADALARGVASPLVGPQLAATLLELLVLVLMRHASALIQPDPLPHCVVHDPVNREELKLLPIAARDFCKVAAALLRSDGVPHVRTAVLAATVAVLTAWSNAVTFTEAVRVGAGGAAGAAPAAEGGCPWLRLDDDLAEALCAHLGELLTEANGVPPDSGCLTEVSLLFPTASTAGSAGASATAAAHASAFSRLFATVQQSLASCSGGAGQEASAAACSTSDSERVRLAALSCVLLGACQHPDVADSTLPAVVLAQALSPREDLQEVAWLLLRRLRREAHLHADSADAFFKVMLHSVYLVHKDAGVEVARDLSSRLLFHVGVGKLAPVMQVSLVAALQAGVLKAMSSSSAEDGCDGLLEALVPWITKHIVDDALIHELVAWIESEVAGTEGADSDGAKQQQGERAGLPALLAACKATIARCEKSAAGGGPGASRGGKRAALAAPPPGEDDAASEERDLNPEPDQEELGAASPPPAAKVPARLPGSGGPAKRRRSGAAGAGTAGATPSQSQRRVPVGPARALGPST